jgi:hypothetical protein
MVFATIIKVIVFNDTINSILVVKSNSRKLINYSWRLLQNIFKNQIACSIFLIMLHNSNFHHLSWLDLHVLLKVNGTLQWIVHLFIVDNLVFLCIILWANHMPLCLVRCFRKIGAHPTSSPTSQLGGKASKTNYTWHNPLRDGIHVDFHNVQMNFPIGHVDFARWFLKIDNRFLYMFIDQVRHEPLHFTPSFFMNNGSFYMYPQF